MVSKKLASFYFGLYNQLCPESILDIGAYLKRCGALSRNVLDKSIDEDVKLDCVDCLENLDTPIYKKIYNDIITLSDFRTGGYKISKSYELCYVFELEQYIATWELELVIMEAVKASKYVVVDVTSKDVLAILEKLQNVSFTSYDMGNGSCVVIEKRV